MNITTIDLLSDKTSSHLGPSRCQLGVYISIEQGDSIKNTVVSFFSLLVSFIIPHSIEKLLKGTILLSHFLRWKLSECSIQKISQKRCWEMTIHQKYPRGRSPGGPLFSHLFVIFSILSTKLGWEKYRQQSDCVYYLTPLRFSFTAFSSFFFPNQISDRSFLFISTQVNIVNGPAQFFLWGQFHCFVDSVVCFLLCFLVSRLFFRHQLRHCNLTVEQKNHGKIFKFCTSN